MAVHNTVEDLARREYKYGFVTDIEADTMPPGLNEDMIRLISAKKNEPEFMLEWRLKAYRHWAKLEKSEAEPKWANDPLSAHRLSGDALLFGAEEAKPTGPRVWTKSIPSCSRRTRSSVFRSRSRSGSPASPSMRCSTAFRWRRRSRASSPRWA